MIQGPSVHLEEREELSQRNEFLFAVGKQQPGPEHPGVWLLWSGEEQASRGTP